MRCLSIFLLLPLFFSPLRPEILPLTIVDERLDWRQSVERCWTKFGVRLASSRFSIERLKDVVDDDALGMSMTKTTEDSVLQEPKVASVLAPLSSLFGRQGSQEESYRESDSAFLPTLKTILQQPTSAETQTKSSAVTRIANTDATTPGATNVKTTTSVTSQHTTTTGATNVATTTSVTNQDTTTTGPTNVATTTSVTNQDTTTTGPTNVATTTSVTNQDAMTAGATNVATTTSVANQDNTTIKATNVATTTSVTNQDATTVGATNVATTTSVTNQDAVTARATNVATTTSVANQDTTTTGATNVATTTSVSNQDATTAGATNVVTTTSVANREATTVRATIDATTASVASTFAPITNIEITNATNFTIYKELANQAIPSNEAIINLVGSTPEGKFSLPSPANATQYPNVISIPESQSNRRRRRSPDSRIENPLRVWTGFFKRGSDVNFWWNQNQDRFSSTKLPLPWCRSPQGKDHDCVAWVKQKTSPTLCLETFDCNSKLRFACEAAKVDFDSAASKIHETEFGSGWSIETGWGSVGSTKMEGPIGDHTLAIGEEEVKLDKPFFENEGTVGASSVYDSGYLPKKAFYDGGYWCAKKNKEIATNESIWFSANEPFSLSKFSFNIHTSKFSNYAPEGKDNSFFLFGSKDETCINDRVTLYTKQGETFFASVKNDKKFKCYGFRINKNAKTDYTAIKYPIIYYEKKCKKTESILRDEHFNTKGKSIKCLPWSKDKYLGNSCTLTDNDKKGDWCYCDKKNGGCTADAQPSSNKKNYYEYCLTACNGKFATNQYKVQRDIYLNSKIDTQLSFFYYLSSRSSTFIGINEQSISLTKSYNWSKYEEFLISDKASHKISIHENGISIDDLVLKQLDKNDNNCQNEHYGKNCTLECNCSGAKKCNTFSGVCPSTCKYGHYGNDCLGQAVCNLYKKQNTKSNCTKGHIVAGTYCSVSCDDGFYRNGTKNRFCEQEKKGESQDANWKNNLASCNKIYCQIKEKDISQTTVLKTCESDTRYEYRHSCLFECKLGQWISDFDNLTSVCKQGEDEENPMGYFSYPKCKAVACYEPITVKNAEDPDCSSSFNSNCTIDCKAGYYRIGGNFNCHQAKINHQASWKEITPTRCDPVNCSLPEIISKTTKKGIGNVNCTEKTFHNSRCNLSCKKGYEMSNKVKNIITCQQISKNKKDFEWLNWNLTTDEICKEKETSTGFCVDIDECKNNPCHNGKSCANSCGDYSCHCGNSYFGKTCKIETPNVTLTSFIKDDIICDIDAVCLIPAPVTWPDKNVVKILIIAFEDNKDQKDYATHLRHRRSTNSACKTVNSNVPITVFTKQENLGKPVEILNGIVRNGSCEGNRLSGSKTYKLSFIIETEVDGMQENRTLMVYKLVNRVPSSQEWVVPFIISLSLVICLAVIITIVILFRRRSKKISRNSTQSVNFSAENRGSVNIAFNTSMQREESGRQKPLPKTRNEGVAVVPPQPRPPRATWAKASDVGSISVKDIFNLVYGEERSAKDFKEEYSSIPDKIEFGHEVSSRPENKGKNRFQDIPAYDHSRVILHQENSDSGDDNQMYVNLKINDKLSDKKTDNSSSDYINANYIPGFFEKKAFIASQGPRRSTVDDFWLMIWQQNVKVLVMLTNLIEEGKKKCEQYWPKGIGCSLSFGGVSVRLENENYRSNYIIREMYICKENEDGSLSLPRRVMQYHFISWPDKDIPRTPSTIASFVHVVRQFVVSSRISCKPPHSPILVHCSAGVGRTGTCIAIWNLLDEAESLGVVNVSSTVRHMRQFRFKMVQTSTQYKLVYNALAIHCGTNLKHENGRHQSQSEFSELFDRLGLISDHTVTKSSFSMMTENSDKNRYRDGPFYQDHSMLHIATFIPPDGNTYINAGFVDTFLMKAGCIVTQAPLENTVDDFWTLVMEQQLGVIVALNCRSDGAPDYWPQTKKKLKLMKVESLNKDRIDEILTKRSMRVCPKEDNDDFDLTHISVDCWPEDDHLPDHMRFYEVLLKVNRLLLTLPENRAKMLVHCLDGCHKSGLFVVALNIMQQVEAEGKLHLPATVLAARATQRRFIVDAEQLEFCAEIGRLHRDNNRPYQNC